MYKKVQVVSTESDNWLTTKCGINFFGRGCDVKLRLHCKKCELCKNCSQVIKHENFIPKKTIKLDAYHLSDKFQEKFRKTLTLE